MVFSDSTYCNESGCEASSRFSFGRWKMEKDWIIFTPTRPSTFKLIDTIIRSGSEAKEISVKVFDSKGENITQRIVVGQYLKGIGYYPIKTDSTKNVRTDLRRKNCKLILPGLQNTFRQSTEIDPGDYTQIEIHLNIPSEWHFHSNSRPEFSPPFKLRKKKDRLLSEDPIDYDEKGNLVFTEYLLEKK